MIIQYLPFIIGVIVVLSMLEKHAKVGARIEKASERLRQVESRFHYYKAKKAKMEGRN